MVLIHFYRDEAGRLAAFEASGHALFGFDDKDIVCAAVSALLQAAILGLEDCVGAHPRYTRNRGHVECTVPPEYLVGDVGRQAEVVLETIFASLKSVAIRYPKNLRIEDVPLASRDGRPALQARPRTKSRTSLDAANLAHGRRHPRHGG